MMLSFCQISNLIGIFPVIYCIQHGLHWFAAILAMSITLSLFYHEDEDNEIALWADMGGCAVLFACFCYILMNSELVLTWSNMVTLLFASMAGTCYLLAGEDVHTENYLLFHTGWHVFALYAISTFIYSYVNTSVEDNNSRVLAHSIRPTMRKGLTRIVSTYKNIVLRIKNHGKWI